MTTAEGQPNLTALLELERCQRINIAAASSSTAQSAAGNNCSHVTLTGNTLHDTREQPTAQHAIRFTGPGEGNSAAHNSVGITSGKPIEGNVKTIDS